MRLRINCDVIKDTTIYIVEQLDIIRKSQDKLKKDINLINDYYKGKDASLIIQKYIDKVNDIDAITKTLDDYIYYFKWLTGSYTDALHEAVTNLQKVTDEVMQIDLSSLEKIEDLNLKKVYIETKDGDKIA